MLYYELLYNNSLVISMVTLYNSGFNYNLLGIHQDNGGAERDGVEKVRAHAEPWGEGNAMEWM